MRYGLWWTPLVVVLVGCDSAGEYRSIIRQQAAAFRETERILDAISDAASLEQAKVLLQKERDKAEQLQEKTQQLASPTEEMVRRLEPDIAELEKALAGLRRAVADVRVRYPDATNVLSGLPGKAALIRD